jgi:hypothetical protein
MELSAIGTGASAPRPPGPSRVDIVRIPSYAGAGAPEDAVASVSPPTRGGGFRRLADQLPAGRLRRGRRCRRCPGAVVGSAPPRRSRHRAHPPATWPAAQVSRAAVPGAAVADDGAETSGTRLVKQAVHPVVSAGAPASQGVPGRLGREPAGRADDVPERPALAHRYRTRWSSSSRTMPHLARSCGSPGARWPPRAACERRRRLTAHDRRRLVG